MDVAGALAAWAGFPILARTRPLIVTSRLIEEPGYTSSDAKVAFYEQRVDVADGVPREAAASLAAEIGPISSTRGHRIVVEEAVRVRRTFRTDRGPQQLDAWSLQITETLAPVVVLDVDERARMWPRSGHCSSAGTAHRLDATDSRFRYTFKGSPRRHTAFDGAEVAAGDTAVAVSPRATALQTAIQSNGRMVAYPAVLYIETRHVEFSLPTPLGARVLVDAWGNPIEVLDE